MGSMFFSEKKKQMPVGDDEFYKVWNRAILIISKALDKIDERTPLL